jgi:hypothetical protein
MKTPILIFCAFFALLITSSCKQINYAGEFETSYNAWLKFKSDKNNSYSYSVKTSSFSGYTTSTTLTIENGKVIKRNFTATTPGSGPNPQLVIQEMWTEEGSTLNTHRNGAPIRTLEEVYAEAKNNWLKKRDNAKTYFEAKNQGMISTAGYVEDGCMDDCFVGIYITGIGTLACCGAVK